MLPWYKILELLHIAPTVAALPCQAACPYCRGALFVFHDPAQDDYYTHCRSCGRAADLLQLAADHWHTSLAEAVLRLSRAGIEIPADFATPERLDRYRQQRHERQQRLRQSLAEARATLIQSPTAASGWFERLRLPPAVGASGNWLRRLVDGLGLIPLYSVLGAIRQDGDEQSVRRGKGWKDMLVLPFYDLPGRLAGVWGLGRDGGPDDQLFVPALSRLTSAQGLRYWEGGLAMYDNLWRRTYQQPFGKDVIFVCDDLTLALRLQSQQLIDSELPLPVVAMQHRQLTIAQPKQHTAPQQISSQQVWKNRPSRRYVFCGQRMTSGLLLGAASTDGWLCVEPYPSKQRLTGRDWLAYVNRYAVLWHTWLARQLLQTDGAELLPLLPEFAAWPELEHKFLATATQTAQDRYRQLAGQSNDRRLVDFGGRQVLESGGTWRCPKTQTIISDTLLRIDRIVYSAERDATYYSGRLLYDGQELAFHEPATAIERQTAAWIRKRLLAAGLGLPQLAKSWTGKLHDLAIQFHRPAVHKAAKRFGWDPTRDAFVLPQYAIQNGGKLLVEPQPTFDDLAPGEILQLPGTLPAPAIAELAADPVRSQLFWAVAACVGANVIAPALGEPRAGIGLIGDGAAIVGRLVARTLGCRERLYKPGRDTAPDLLDKLLESEQRHNWPIYVAVPGNQLPAALLPWLTASGERNVLIDLPQLAADALVLDQPWRFVRHAPLLLSAPELAQHGPAVLSAWLLDLCERQLQLPGKGDLSRRVLADMADWALRTCGTQDGILAANAVLKTPPIDRPTWLRARWVGLVEELAAAGKFRYLPYRGKLLDSGPMAGYWLPAGAHPAGLFIVQAELAATALKYQLPLPAMTRLTAVFQEMGGLLAEIDVDGRHGWLFDGGWWHRCIDTLRQVYHQQHTTKLRVI